MNRALISQKSLLATLFLLLGAQSSLAAIDDNTNTIDIGKQVFADYDQHHQKEVQEEEEDDDEKEFRDELELQNIQNIVLTISGSALLGVFAYVTTLRNNVRDIRKANEEKFQ